MHIKTLTTSSAPALEAIPGGGGQRGPVSIESIRSAVHEARAALAALLGAAGVDATKTRETSRVLNVNRGLAWRVSRVVGAEDDVTAATHMPGALGLERLLEACRERGVREDALGAARAAVAAFHGLVGDLPGDKRTLEILLANAAAGGTSLDLESARRAMFDGGCAVWGVRADVRIRAEFVAPSATPGMIDEAGVGGYVNLRRLRQVAWPMSYRAVYRDDGSAQGAREELIEPGTDAGALGLLREFCSPPGITIQTVKTSRATRHELPVMPGRGAEPTTCVFGGMFRALWPMRATPDCRDVGSIVVMDTPVERVIFDVFVHRGLGLEGPPEVVLADRMTRPHGYNAEELASEALPIDTPVRRLGRGAAATVTPHVPWYPRMIERVCARLGFGPEEFAGYRIELTYPPIPTGLVARYTLPGA